MLPKNAGNMAQSIIPSRPYAFRTERDPLGERAGPRRRATTASRPQRAVENFPISGLRAHADLVTATVLVKKAAAEANAALGRLTRDIGRRHRRGGRRDPRRRAARPVRRGRLPGGRRHLAQHERERGAGQPRRRAPGRHARRRTTLVHPNDHVNMGQSTNDVFPTATRLALLLGIAAAVGPRRDARDGAAAQGATSSRRPEGRAARTCRTPCRSRSARSSAATPACVDAAARRRGSGGRRSCAS